MVVVTGYRAKALRGDVKLRSRQPKGVTNVTAGATRPCSRPKTDRGGTCTCDWLLNTAGKYYMMTPSLHISVFVSSDVDEKRVTTRRDLRRPGEWHRRQNLFRLNSDAPSASIGSRLGQNIATSEPVSKTEDQQTGRQTPDQHFLTQPRVA